MCPILNFFVHFYAFATSMKKESGVIHCIQTIALGHTSGKRMVISVEILEDCIKIKISLIFQIIVFSLHMI